MSAALAAGVFRPESWPPWRLVPAAPISVGVGLGSGTARRSGPTVPLESPVLEGMGELLARELVRRGGTT